MKEKISFIIKYIIRIILHIFWVLPVDSKKIYFRSFHGKKIACSPKYLWIYIREKFGNEYKCVWELEEDKEIPGAFVVKRLTLKSFIAMMTSRYIITNNDFMWWIPLRKKQVMLETWHGGGAYKRVGSYEKWSPIMLLDQKLNSRQITHYISSCKKFTEIQTESKWVPEEKFINTGLPRSEIFFHKEKIAELRKKVFSFYNIKDDTHVVLYAPTYRGLTGYKGSNQQVSLNPDYRRLLEELGKKFGGNWILFFRSHYFDSKLAKGLPDSIVDATGYEDMQELLCAADVLITDFSSSMWDFALLGKPCFLYAPDIMQYIEDRGFYTDPFTWPFPMAKNDNELAENIGKFDEEKNKLAAKKHLEELGSYENEYACRKVLEEIGFFHD